MVRIADKGGLMIVPVDVLLVFFHDT